MKVWCLVCALCFALGVSSLACGGADTTGSETQTTASAEKEKNAGTGEEPFSPPAAKVIVGHHEPNGPFAGVSGSKGTKKVRFEPSGRPAPRQTVIRDLRVGSGPAAERGDEVGIYYAGADHRTGKIEFYTWPSYTPATLQLGRGTFFTSWERNIDGMRVGGLREVVISDESIFSTPLDYVIAMTALRRDPGAS